MKNKTYLIFSSIIIIGIVSCGSDDGQGPAVPGDTGRLPGSILMANGDRFMSSVLVDVDGDGDQDMMLGAVDRENIPKDYLLINDGQGNFSEAPSSNMPARYGGANFGTDQLRAGDFDDDGDNDVLAVVHGPLPSEDATVMFYQNNGSGVFTDASTKINYVAPPNGLGGLVIGNLELADVDNDNDMDFLLSQGGTHNAIYLNDGEGNYSNANFPDLDDEPFRIGLHVTGADINKDGFTDILALPHVYINDGNNNYTLYSNYELPWPTYLMGITVENNLGNPMLIAPQFIFLDVAGNPTHAFQFSTNNELIYTANEVFSTVRKTVHPRNIYSADFDGNGLMDVVVADHGFDSYPFPGNQNTLFLQQTNGTFIDASGQLPEISDFTHDIAIGDIDGDGDIDIYASNLTINQDYPYFMINDGQGNFTLER